MHIYANACIPPHLFFYTNSNDLHELLHTCFFLFFFLKKILFIHERPRERQRHRQREKQAPCREPDAGLDPRTPESRPGPKAVLNRSATQAAPNFNIINEQSYI